MCEDVRVRVRVLVRMQMRVRVRAVARAGTMVRAKRGRGSLGWMVSARVDACVWAWV